MKNVLRAVLLLGLSCTALWAEDNRHLLDGAFTTITDVNQLPDAVKKALTPEGSPRIDMANPGQLWNAGCTGSKWLHRQRLIFGGVSGERCFVHYEQGGIALMHYVKLFRLEPNQKATLLWTGVSGRGARNLDELRSMITSGAIREIVRPRLLPPRAPVPARRGAASTAPR